MGTLQSPEGEPKGATKAPDALVARPGGGRARWPPGWGLAPSGPTLVIPEASVMLIFYIFWLEFFGHYRYE